MLFKIISVIAIILSLYGIINLFIGKMRPFHLKKNVSVNNKYYKYYYLFSYTMLLVMGICVWQISLNEDLLLNPIYFYFTIINFPIIQLIGAFFIDPKYTSK